MEINISITKITVKEEKKHKIVINGQTPEQVKTSKYLGAMLKFNGKADKEQENFTICAKIHFLNKGKYQRRSNHRYIRKS